MITGSAEYPGAGRLSLESALRGGVGLVTYLGEKERIERLLSEFPEAIYAERASINELSEGDILDIIALADKHSSVIIGSGCGRTRGLYRIVKALLLSYSGKLILDADALNVLAEQKEEMLSLFRESSAKIIITPHPLEFSRLTGMTVDQINSDRINKARDFSLKYGCITVLKGAATVTTDGEYVYVNSSGSSALAKAGSGDVLAGFLASLVSFSDCPLSASAAAVYLHGKAADVLAETLSEYGVIPSDLPLQIAKEIAKSKH